MKKKTNEQMKNIYNYKRTILERYPDLRYRILSRTMVPYQVELHPPPAGKKLCWLNCTYCYTQGELNECERISEHRLVELVQELGQGSRTGEKPEKIIFSGIRSDPLKSNSMTTLYQVAKANLFSTGIHTKGVRLNSKLADILTVRSLEHDYISFSVDAYDNPSYNQIHGINPYASVYTLVTRNIHKLATQIRDTQSPLKINVTYLLTEENCDPEKISEEFITKFLAWGVHRLRFSVPIIPIPRRQARKSMFTPIMPDTLKSFEDMLKAFEADPRVIYLKFTENAHRTLPCFSRWLTPTIGFDGYLYPCPVVAFNTFQKLRLGDLKQEAFWKTYYKETHLDYRTANCQCCRMTAQLNRVIQQKLRKIRRPVSSKIQERPRNFISTKLEG